ncbi:MAG: hypothetical protein II080_09550, partial [Lachnospiraceae bacterium]|nr:hypothetical protein [Lachnospiraceae bacterium]
RRDGSFVFPSKCNGCNNCSMSVEAYGGRRMRDFSFSGSCSRIITDDGEEDIIKEDKNMWMEYDRCGDK